ncbi:Glucuronoxylan 4-O-methyltransferase 3 [Platanthera guangdongensis]|uniref:Glucuronoxylan 4-O-methyltransferase 3 n=1 Tax=Platanthera guangdongensis TaxID=2320717 RepID=A0ABR2N5W2_9ASPA
MKHKAAHSSFNMKPLLLCFALLALLVIILRSCFSSSPDPQSTQVLKPATTPKIAPSLANTIIHYATSNITPQQTFDEISVAARVLEKRSPCNFLVFGLGHDSLMWSALNHGGRTVFLEEDRAWMEKIRERFPDLESYHAVYKTRVKEADELLKLRAEKECTEMGDARNSKCPLSLMDLPAVFYETEWDLIMVDAPTGYFADAPGRMGAIYTAGMVARARRRGKTDVFVHDVDRVVEDEFSMAFLCKGYLKEQEGRIRHFAIPSHRSAVDLSFCP